NGNGTWQSPPVQVASLQGTISNGGTIPLPSGYTQGQCTWMVSLRTVNINNDQHATQMHTYVVKADVSANRVVTLSDTGNVSNLTANYIIIGIK
ncbi:MAG: hypothetical protein CUN57_02520, partial [Phototrophicales bacterium]